jgi:hypothetical protein
MRNLIAKAALVVVMGIVGCSNDLSYIQAPEGVEQGAATLSIEVAQVGILAKVSQFEMDELVVTLTAEGEEPVVQSFEVSRRGGNTIEAEFANLASFKNWSVSAHTVDKQGVVIHSGDASFYVKPNQTVDVSLDLDATYSGLEAVLRALPDSVTSLELAVDGVVVDVVSATDKLTLSYDYLTVDEEHEVTLIAKGVLWGEAMELYEGTVTVKPESGKDQKYPLVMKWVGADAPPTGTGVLEIHIGTIGTETINTQFEKHTIKYTTEKEKDKKPKKK